MLILPAGWLCIFGLCSVKIAKLQNRRSQKHLNSKLQNSNQSQFPSSEHFPIKPFIIPFFTGKAMRRAGDGWACANHSNCKLIDFSG